jgi:hypothetical protein
VDSDIFVLAARDHFLFLHLNAVVVVVVVVVVVAVVVVDNYRRDRLFAVVSFPSYFAL